MFTPLLKMLGFTLMELLVSIAVIAILVAIAVPTYYYYTQRAQYDQVVQAANLYKIPVTRCLIKNQGKLTNCNAGQSGIPANTVLPNQRVASVTVINGIITATPKAGDGISTSDTYVLTPTYSAEGIVWKPSGGGCKVGFAPNCR